MADIDKITASNGTTYNIKDSTARDSISQKFPAASAYDLDNLTTTGLYWCTNQSTNLPETGRGGGLLVIAFNSTICTQLLMPTDIEHLYYRRHKTNGGWTAWVEL